MRALNESRGTDLEQPISLAARTREAFVNDVRADAFRDLLSMLRRRIALLLLTLAAVYVLGVLYYFKQERIYEGQSRVLVHRTGDTLKGGSIDVPSSQYNYLPTHIQLISSPAVLSMALEHLAANDMLHKTWPTVNQLAGGLAVAAEKDTEILEIRYRTTDRALAAPVLQAVVDSYQDFINEAHRSASNEILQILTQQRKDLDQELRVKEAELLALQQRQVNWAAEGGKNEQISQVASMSQALTQARVRRLEAEGRLQALREAIQRGNLNESYLLPYLERLGRDVAARRLGLAGANEGVKAQEETVRKELMQRKVELERLRNFYGPSHPRLIAEADRIRLLEQALNQDKAAAEKPADPRELRALAIYFQEQELDEAKKVEQDLAEQYEVEQRRAAEVGARRAPMLALETELGRLRSYYDTLINRIREVDVGNDYVAITTRVIAPAQEPSAPISPNARRIAMLCGMLGLLFGVGICYLAEWWDPRFGGPADIAQHLGMPVIGHIPRVAKLSPEAPFAMIVSNAPTSVEAEAFRSLRSALMLCDSPPRKFTITSSAPGDGKTSLLTNLAISYAQSGLRTLLIDSDMRRPALTRFFKFDDHNGLAQLLGQEGLTPEDVWASIHPTVVERLHILPSGPSPSDPAERLGSDRLVQIVQWAESRYDRILFDAPPILAASDAAILSRVLDGVLFVVRADKSDRRATTAACNTLGRMNCHALGVIVNGVDRGSGYGYDHYYRSGYYYADQSSQQDNEASETCSDDRPAPFKRAA